MIPPRRARRPRPQGPRIVFVEHKLDDDGATRSSLRLVQRWGAAGVPVKLYAVEQSSRDSGAAVPAPVRVRRLTPVGWRLRWAAPLGMVRLVVAAHRCEVVVSGREIGLGLLAGRLAALLARRPFVVMVRSAPGPAVDSYVRPRLRGVTRRALTTASSVVCITPGLIPAVEAAGVPSDRIRMVLNGIEVEDVTKAGSLAPTAAALPPGEGPLVVGVGRLEKQKGFDVLVRAHAQLAARGTTARLLLLGEGREREALRLLARELGVADSVHMPGHTPPLPFVAAADLYCLPSRWEGFGQSLAEALVLGTPVIAADCVSGPRLLLADSAHGDLVPVEDHMALAEAMARHLAAPQRLRDAALVGQAWAREHLDVDRTAAGVLTVLTEVTAPDGLRPPASRGAAADGGVHRSPPPSRPL